MGRTSRPRITPSQWRGITKAMKTNTSSTEQINRSKMTNSTITLLQKKIDASRAKIEKEQLHLGDLQQKLFIERTKAMKKYEERFKKEE